MPIEARVTKIWKNQKALLVLLLLGFCIAFLFDGFIRYPRLNAQYRKYREFAEAKDEKGWETFAASQGWDATPPEKEHSEIEQFVWAGMTGILGLIALTFWLTQRNRVLRMDDEAVTSPSGTRVPFSAITGIDSKKWKSKGIARIKYSLDGKHGVFVVDDYKFERKATDEIYEEIEKRLNARAEG